MTTRKKLTIGIASFFISSGMLFAAVTQTKVVSPSKLKVAVWMPYWKADDAVLEALAHTDVITEMSPFAYEIQSDGKIKDTLASTTEPFSYLYENLEGKNMPIIPSILWTSRLQMQTILNSKTKRDTHIKEIVALVKKNKYAGIDIDYEGKSAETRVGFSTFLIDLQKQLKKNKKTLVCTIEARTPVDSRYATVTPELLARIEYANDYKVIGKVCDEVRLMTYDQAGDDQTLEVQNKAGAYKAVADIEWVKKVVTLTLNDIPAKKLFVGVPTYGYKYEIIPPAGNATSTKYARIGAMNYKYADELARQLHITPTRHASGEIYYTYSTTTDLYGNSLGGTKQYLIWYSDAAAIADKVRIAKLYGLAGVAVFKVDGANDPSMWSILK